MKYSHSWLMGEHARSPKFLESLQRLHDLQHQATIAEQFRRQLKRKVQRDAFNGMMMRDLQERLVETLLGHVPRDTATHLQCVATFRQLVAQGWPGSRWRDRWLMCNHAADGVTGGIGCDLWLCPDCLSVRGNRQIAVTLKAIAAYPDNYVVRLTRDIGHHPIDLASLASVVDLVPAVKTVAAALSKQATPRIRRTDGGLLTTQVSSQRNEMVIHRHLITCEPRTRSNRRLPSVRDVRAVSKLLVRAMRYPRLPAVWVMQGRADAIWYLQQGLSNTPAHELIGDWRDPAAVKARLTGNVTLTPGEVQKITKLAMRHGGSLGTRDLTRNLASIARTREQARAVMTGLAEQGVVQLTKTRKTRGRGWPSGWRITLISQPQIQVAGEVKQVAC